MAVLPQRKFYLPLINLHIYLYISKTEVDQKIRSWSGLQNMPFVFLLLINIININT